MNPRTEVTMPRKKGAKTVLVAMREAMYAMSLLGVRNCEIALHHHVHRSTVSHIIRQQRITKKTCIKKRGCKRKSSERGLHLFHRYVRDYCFEPLYIVLARFKTTTGMELCTSTGKRYIKLLKMECFIAIQKPFLSKKNVTRRVLWARMHENWILEQWSQVAFTDESSFAWRLRQNRLYVRRVRGKRLHQNYIVPTFKSGYQTVSVWGCFSMKGRRPLFGVIRSFTQTTYRVIIDNHVLPFMYDIHEGPASFVL